MEKKEKQEFLENNKPNQVFFHKLFNDYTKER